MDPENRRLMGNPEIFQQLNGKEGLLAVLKNGERLVAEDVVCPRRHTCFTFTDLHLGIPGPWLWNREN